MGTASALSFLSYCREVSEGRLKPGTVSPAADGALYQQIVFVLALGALSAFYAVWRGAGIPGYALLMVSLVGSTVAYMSLASHFPSQELPLWVAVAIAGAGLSLAFVLIRCVLIHSSQVYRIQADPFGRVLQPK